MNFCPSAIRAEGTVGVGAFPLSCDSPSSRVKPIMGQAGTQNRKIFFSLIEKKLRGGD